MYTKILRRLTFSRCREGERFVFLRQATLNQSPFDLRQEHLECKFAADDFPAVVSELGAQSFIAQQAIESFGKQPRVARRDQQAIDAVLHEIRDTAARRSDHRAAEGHCLQENQPKSLARARQSENVGAGVAGRQFLARKVVQKMDAVGDAKFGSKRSQPWQVVTSAHYDQLQTRSPGPELRDRADEIVRALISFRGGPAANGQNDLTSRQRRRCSKFCGSIGPAEKGCAQRPGEPADFCRSDALNFCELSCRIVARSQDNIRGQ